MRKNLFLFLCAFVILSCTKKKESDPQPVVVEQKQTVTNEKPAAYWPLIRTTKSQCCPNDMGAGSQYETYEGHDDTKNPKADKWRIKIYSRNTNTGFYDILLSDNIVLIWWENNEPKSTYFKFKQIEGEWYRSNKELTEWFKYTMGN